MGNEGSLSQYRGLAVHFEAWAMCYIGVHKKQAYFGILLTLVKS